MHKKCLVFGSLNMDFVYEVDHIVNPGETISSKSMKCHCGGKGMNQAIALAKADADVFIAGRIGSDGMVLMDSCRKAGVDVSCLTVSDTLTGRAMIQVDRKGQNSIVLFAGTNKEHTEKEIVSVLDHFEEGDYLLLQNEINQTDFIIREGYRRGLKIVLNPSPFEKEIMDYGLDKLSWLILNEVEAFQMTGEKEAERAVEKLRKMLSREAGIVLTLGEEGALCSYGDMVYRQACYSCETVDTTAAGDTFTGFFFAHIVKKQWEIREALDEAAKAAAITVSRRGAADSIPLLEELKENIRDEVGR